MATKKQKQELIDVLKFTPITVRVMIQGYGGESYAGRVERRIYDFFKEHRIDLDEYAGDWDQDFNDRVPNEFQPFPPGSPYECDDLFHASGAELSDLNEIRIENSVDGTDIWVHNCGYGDLEESGVTVEESGGAEIYDHVDDDFVVFWGGQGEKGCFFDGEFVLRAPFDPKKLRISYENCDDWYIITSVIYDGEDIDGSGGYSTNGKWSENKWVLPPGEEVYESISRDEIEDESDLSEARTDADSETDRSPWHSADIRPDIKGEYEVFEKDSSWPFPQRAQWTGRSWKQNGEKIIIREWRGLNYNPEEA